MDRLSRERLKWKCRRGRLELDLVLARIVPTLGDEDVASLNALLELADDDLWDIAVGRSDDFDPQLSRIVARLRAA
ncbi:MAG: succinate dehydrogenase assembly factor 2 [Burkholderiales bacterium]